MPRRVRVPKTDFVFARVTPEEREVIQRAADGEYLSVSSWVRQTLLKAAAERLGLPDDAEGA